MATEKHSIGKEHLATGRAVDQLRRQLGIVFEEDSGVLLGAYPVEGLTPEIFEDICRLAAKPIQLLITGARARYLGFTAPNAKTVCIPVEGLSFSTVLALADPLHGESLPSPAFLPASSSHETLMLLAKHASLLPALLLIVSDQFPQEWLRVSAADVAAYWKSPPLDIVPLAHAALPIEETTQATVTCFRTRYGTSMHLALSIGTPKADSAPLVRIHSSCVTGDILGSLRCDCGSQLKLAISKIIAEGSGILIYLHQEGRGIGLTNKLRAYALQERGIDTYDANLMLGFDEDERDFSLAAAILRNLGIEHIRLMTNNPRKLAALEAHGIHIAGRVPLAVESGAHNHAYLEAKAKKSGHLF